MTAWLMAHATLDNFLQAYVAITGVLAIQMIKGTGRPQRERWGFLIGAAGQPAWLLVTWRAEQWGLFVLAIFFLHGWTTGAWERWTRR